MEATLLVWDGAFLAYDFGPGHPMAPVRLDLTARLCRDLGLYPAPGVRLAAPDPADDELLHLVHEPRYVEAVRAASTDPAAADPAFGVGTDDVPAFRGMHEAAARIVAGTVAAAGAVWRGEVRAAVNFTGGMHHAMPALASGFCVYNDAAVAIRHLLDAGAERVAYVDVDVHHGDGVERAFRDDPRVLTVSLHETGQLLFPGTGHPSDIGGPAAEGCSVNVALPAGTGDAAWLRAFHAVVPPLLRAFRPQLLVSQHGCDSHYLDPLAHLALSVDGQRAAALALRDLAAETAGGRWVALGGGGYEVVDVVPRCWAHLVGLVTGREVPPTAPVPPDWAAYVGALLGRTPPGRMTDGGDAGYTSWEHGHDPADAVDRAVMATRRAVFPLHGLDPWFD